MGSGSIGTMRSGSWGSGTMGSGSIGTMRSESWGSGTMGSGSIGTMRSGSWGSGTWGSGSGSIGTMRLVIRDDEDSFSDMDMGFRTLDSGSSSFSSSGFESSGDFRDDEDSFSDMDMGFRTLDSASSSSGFESSSS